MVAISVWNDAEWQQLAEAMELDAATRERFAKQAARLADPDGLEAQVGAWTRQHTREDVEQRLQARGVEAVAVMDFADLHDDPQLEARQHFVTLPHPVAGEWLFERNGFRLDASPGGYAAACPTLGQHADEILRDLLGLPEAEIERLRAEGGVESEG